MAELTTNVPQPAWGDNGFSIPSDDAVLAGVQADIQAAFGGRLNMSPATPQGQLASSMAAIISNTYQNFLYYVNQVDPAFARGRMQDAIGYIYFLTRTAAEPTVVDLLCVGLPGTVIPALAQALDTSGNIYLSFDEATIPDSGEVLVSFYNQTPGPIPCPANTVTKIYKTVPGWDTVDNPNQGVLGNDTEGRASFEERRIASVAGNSRGTIQAVQGAVLAVKNVLDAFCYQNDTDSPTTYRGVLLAAHSIYVAVVGGEDLAVATAIWSKKSPGCAYNGNTTVTVQDTGPGYSAPYPTYAVVFERPTATPVGFSVRIKSNPGVPSDARLQVQTAIVDAFAGGDGGARARIGSTIFASRFYAPVARLGPWAELISIHISEGFEAAAEFTASVSGTTMTVSAVSAGALAKRQTVTGLNMKDAVILSQLSGSAGSTGTYQLSVSQTAGPGPCEAYLVIDSQLTMDIDLAPTTSAEDILVSFDT